jgi:guanylate kinase
MAKKRVPEPVQVYLERPEHERLERLARQLGTAKSDNLRRGLHALERELTDPASHPALRLVGIADESEAPAVDAARKHDAVLADGEERSWGGDAG